MEARLLNVDGADGYRADLEVFAANESRAGILWLPAMGVPARKYQAFARALAEHGVTVALHEWRGAERSNRRAARGSDWSYRDLLADIADSRAALAAHGPDVDRWWIGGHSLGAQIGGLAAALSPDDYRGLAVVGSGQPWWRGFPLAHRPALLGVFAGFRLLAALFGHFPGDRVGFGAREARGVVRDWARSGLTGRYEPDGMEVDLEAALATFAHPTVVVRFSNDWYVPSGSVTHLLKKLASSPHEVHVLDGSAFVKGKADHFAWMRDPEPVAKPLAAAIPFIMRK